MLLVIFPFSICFSLRAAHNTAVEGRRSQAATTSRHQEKGLEERLQGQQGYQRPQEAQEVHVPPPHRLQTQVPHAHPPPDRRTSSHRRYDRICRLLLRPLCRRSRTQEGLTMSRQLDLDKDTHDETEEKKWEMRLMILSMYEGTQLGAKFFLYL